MRYMQRQNQQNNAMLISPINKRHIYVTRVSINNKKTLLCLARRLGVSLEDLLKPY